MHLNSKFANTSNACIFQIFSSSEKQRVKSCFFPSQPSVFATAPANTPSYLITRPSPPYGEVKASQSVFGCTGHCCCGEPRRN
ncbi:hypothetical protein AtNW77_Chr1g0064701 [Arabidopsis thaliana]|uniref:Uncharacterized protein n=1 Tax=Arabidopsis thaliana x Arabidopsis arenosa TaxID=1240361 RepID=A0A8T2GT25_9BRAS|nr:hypothetical protein ISN45_At01g054910 [Arabidopsis thaliana x Arabidopsis arenosa]